MGAARELYASNRQAFLLPSPSPMDPNEGSPDHRVERNNKRFKMDPGFPHPSDIVHQPQIHSAPQNGAGSTPSQQPVSNSLSIPPPPLTTSLPLNPPTASAPDRSFYPHLHDRANYSHMQLPGDAEGALPAPPVSRGYVHDRAGFSPLQLPGDADVPAQASSASRAYSHDRANPAHWHSQGDRGVVGSQPWNTQPYTTDTRPRIGCGTGLPALSGGFLPSITAQPTGRGQLYGTPNVTATLEPEVSAERRAVAFYNMPSGQSASRSTARRPPAVISGSVPNPGRAHRFCHSCNHINHVRTKFCKKCGTPKPTAMKSAIATQNRRPVQGMHSSAGLHTSAGAASGARHINEVPVSFTNVMAGSSAGIPRSTHTAPSQAGLPSPFLFSNSAIRTTGAAPLPRASTLGEEEVEEEWGTAIDNALNMQPGARRE